MHFESLTTLLIIAQLNDHMVATVENPLILVGAFLEWMSDGANPEKSQLTVIGSD